MNILINKEQTTLIIPETINFKELINNTLTLSPDAKSEMIELINNELTEQQQQLYMINLYMCMNFNPTTDFPINLDHVYKQMGFANKGNAMKTIKSNFTKDEDYKILLVPTEKQVHGGHNHETVMLNIDTYKTLCMLVKTPQGKEIRKYYVKLENIYNSIIKKEIKQNQLLLENKTKEITQNQLLLENKTNEIKKCRVDLELVEFNLETKKHKINLLTRKTNKHENGQSVYIFHSTINEDDKVVNLYKLGRTKNANNRDSIHKTSSYKGLLLQVCCVDSVLLERNVHFLLNKYRKTNIREWFDCSFDIMKNAINYAKLVLEKEIDFENFDINSIKIPIIDNNLIKDNIQDIDIDIPKDIFTKLNHLQTDIDEFDIFINEYCEFNKDVSMSYTTLKDQYKIWSKTANHSQTKKLIDYVKTKYVSFMKKCNPLVSTSKMTLHFRCLKFKDVVYNFTDTTTNHNNLIIENFLFEKCQRAPGFRVTMQDLYKEFEQWFPNEFTFIVKEKIKVYMDILFVRSRSGDESNNTDNRLSGWAGLALKTNEIPEPIKKYKPKNAKVILQKNLSNDVIKSFDSVSDLSYFLQKSRTVTSNIVNSHKPIIIENIQYTFEYQNDF